MKNSIKKITIVFGSIALAVVVMSFINSPTIEQETKEWVVPAAVNKMKNPTKATAADIKIGASLYAQHCKSCHGKTGEGDGSKAAELDTDCGDFTTEQFQSQTDGSLFYKTKEGRDDMPSFKKKLSEDEDVWLIVNFLRTLLVE